MIRKIVQPNAEFGDVACTFFSLAGMYGGEENRPAHSPSAAWIPSKRVGDVECCVRQLAIDREQETPASTRQRDKGCATKTCAPAGRSLCALRAAFVRVITALRELADELDAAGLSPMGTSALNEAREFGSMLVAALQRLERANDNNHSRKTA